MEDRLRSYTENLNWISESKETISCKILPEKICFDLQKLDSIENKKFVQWLTSKSKKDYIIMNDLIKKYETKLRKVKNDINNEQSKEIEKYKKITKDNTNKLEVESEINNIKIKYEQKYETEKNKFEDKKNYDLSNLQSLKKLELEIKEIKNDTGREQLYIGFPFVEGKLSDGTFIRTPLYLFPVSLNADKFSVSISKKEDNYILLNKMFLLIHNKINKSKIGDINIKYDNLDKDFINITLNELNKFEININNRENEIKEFANYTDTDINNCAVDNLVISQNLVLGHFRIINSVYSDYEKITSEELNEILNILLDNQSNISCNESDTNLTQDEKSLSTNDLFLTSIIDHEQEKIINNVRESSNIFYIVLLEQIEMRLL